jgi:hypothetical protein
VSKCERVGFATDMRVETDGVWGSEPLDGLNSFQGILSYVTNTVTSSCDVEESEDMCK